MFESSTVAAAIQSELDRLRTDGRDRSLGELVELVGACQSLVNQVTALQTLALAHVAAVEDVGLEDGTVVEQHRGLGHQRLDAPALVSDQLGVSDAVASSRLSVAVDVVTRVPGVFEAMGAGRLDEYRARVVAEELRDAPVEVCAQVVARVAGSLGSEPAAVLRRRVRRVLAAVDPDLVRAKAARARSERGLRRWPGDEPGVDTWMGSFPAEQSRSGWAVIDGLARQYVLEGKAVGVEQARADALMDLIHARASGTFVVQLAVPADQLTEPDQPTEPDEPTEPTEQTEPSAAADPDGDAVPAEAADAATPPEGEDEALVTVAGLGMPGTTKVRRGWVTSLADAARAAETTDTPDAAHAGTADTTDATHAAEGTDATDTMGDVGATDHAGTTVSRSAARLEVVACHAETGALLPVSADPDKVRGHRAIESRAYRPPAALIDLVKARDGQCRFPGCTINAQFCDVDHVRPWPFGQTHAANLMCLCRRHHRIKQTVRWRVRIEPDATVTWTDPLGRLRTTLPQDFLQLENRQVANRQEDIPSQAPPPPVPPPPLGLVSRGTPVPIWSAWEDELAHQRCAAERATPRPGRGAWVGARLDVSTHGRVVVLDQTYGQTCERRRPGRAGRRARADEPPPF